MLDKLLAHPCLAPQQPTAHCLTQPCLGCSNVHCCLAHQCLVQCCLPHQFLGGPKVNSCPAHRWLVCHCCLGRRWLAR